MVLNLSNDHETTEDIQEKFNKSSGFKQKPAAPSKPEGLDTKSGADATKKEANNPTATTPKTKR